ncbi:MAG: LysR family transcriptional regulator [Heyndrickxia sp.]
MEWHQIQYFQTVAETEHFTRAAEILNISQPALSRAISKLEQELGVQLFDRNGRNIVLNKYGKIFLQRVERSIEEIELGKQEIHDMIHPEHGTISLSFLHSLGISFIPSILQMFLTNYPEVRFHLSQSGSNQVFEKLLTGECDIALLSYFQDDKELHWESLWSEELFLIVSANHRFSSKDEIDLIEIKDEPFIAFKNGYGLRSIVDQICFDADFTPKVAFEGEEIGTVAGLVEAKLGVSIVPDVKVLDKNKIKLIRIRDPICRREIGLTWKKGRYLSPVTKKFIDFVKSLSHVEKL